MSYRRSNSPLTNLPPIKGLFDGLLGKDNVPTDNFRSEVQKIRDYRRNPPLWRRMDDSTKTGILLLFLIVVFMGTCTYGAYNNWFDGWGEIDCPSGHRVHGYMGGHYVNLCQD